PFSVISVLKVDVEPQIGHLEPTGAELSHSCPFAQQSRMVMMTGSSAKKLTVSCSFRIVQFVRHCNGGKTGYNAWTFVPSMQNPAYEPSSSSRRADWHSSRVWPVPGLSARIEL